MSEELHELVEEYMKDWCGVDDMHILHEEIDNPELRSDIYKCFMEWVEGKYEKVMGLKVETELVDKWYKNRNTEKLAEERVNWADVKIDKQTI